MSWKWHFLKVSKSWCRTKKWRKTFLALSGAQGVKLSVCMAQTCLKHWVFIRLISLSQFCLMSVFVLSLTYFVRQMEPNILCLVYFYITWIFSTCSSVRLALNFIHVSFFSLKCFSWLTWDWAPPTAVMVLTVGCLYNQSEVSITSIDQSEASICLSWPIRIPHYLATPVPI